MPVTLCASEGVLPFLRTPLGACGIIYTMKNSTKGMLYGASTGLALLVFTLLMCDSSCGESPIYLFAALGILLLGFVGAMVGEVWHRKIARTVIMLIVVLPIAILFFNNFSDLLG